MKNHILCVAIILLLLCISSCRKEKSIDVKSSQDNSQTVSKYDLDVSKMNYDMLSSLTFDILTTPEKYVDKTIKTSGKFYTSIHENIRYYSVLVWDSTGCCPAGFDFIPPANMKFPEDFPENDEEITVTGTFKYMKLNEEVFLGFKADEILKNSK